MQRLVRLGYCIRFCWVNYQSVPALLDDVDVIRIDQIGHRPPIQVILCHALLGKSHIPSDLVVDQGPVDAETSSPLDFLLLHDLWTTLRRL